MNTQALDIQWQNLSPEKKQKALDLLFGEFISKRTKAALAKAKKNRKLGRPPFGYMFQGPKLVEHPDQIVTLKRMIELRDSGVNNNQIMHILNDENRPSATGKRWAYQSVRMVMKRQP